MIWIIALGILVAAYLLGSIPTGYIIAKTLKGIDIREHGSGNTGATNVFRVVGTGAGILALTIDLLKGLLAVSLARFLTTLATTQVAVPDATGFIAWTMTLAGLLAILGHSRSIWLNFTGGKSAATGLGVLIALAWPVGLGALAVFVTVFALFKIVSLGSMSAAIAAPLLMILTQQPLPFLLLALAAGIYVILRHRSNISRLLAGQEPKIGRSV
jgi:glycerol-3-phosphate acyltransferase PlsY